MCVFVNYPIPAIAQKLGTPILAYMYIFRGYRFFILFIPKNSFSVLIISKPLLINSLAKKRFRKVCPCPSDIERKIPAKLSAMHLIGDGCALSSSHSCALLHQPSPDTRISAIWHFGPCALRSVYFNLCRLGKRIFSIVSKHY